MNFFPESFLILQSKFWPNVVLRPRYAANLRVEEKEEVKRVILKNRNLDYRNEPISCLPFNV